MKILVTGANGFVGKNLCVALREQNHEVIQVSRDTSEEDIVSGLEKADFIFHLAGVNRPQNDDEFIEGNVGFTQKLISLVEKTQRVVPLVYTSSIQAENETPYGLSKKKAEQLILDYGIKTGSTVYVYRLPNIFGKWCNPYYNSAVATFCHNIANGKDITINDPAAVINLVYIDDLITAFMSLLESDEPGGMKDVDQVYTSTVGEVAEIIQSFEDSRQSMIIPRVGTSLTRALYATYVSYLPTNKFSYKVAKHEDERGLFVEMLKTIDSGQFSFFTAHPGITRGEHYHHTKTEKFLVIKGTARYGFRHIITNETFEIDATGDEALIVETIPGWTHNITNIGEEEMIVMLWANEIFDRDKPDTIAQKV